MLTLVTSLMLCWSVWRAVGQALLAGPLVLMSANYPILCIEEFRQADAGYI